jgi:hypothetical protein
MGEVRNIAIPRQVAVVESYEDRLSRNVSWALSEASDYFQDRGNVRKTLRRISAKLDELQIPYAVAGGLALFSHGFRRFTEDVDILVTKDSLSQIHSQLEGLGYVAPFTGSKNLRDTETGVRIEFLVTGQFPGDGKPKPVAFPDPASVAVESDGTKYLNLHALMELKLASGMTNPDRGKDLIDVQELIKSLNLPADFSDKLNPFVRDKYLEIWNLLRSSGRRYIKLWPHGLRSVSLGSLDQLVDALRVAGNTSDANVLAAMQAEGIALDTQHSCPEGYVRLATTNPDVAAKYDMHEESEFLDGQ